METTRLRAYYLIGPPASGKGTHGKIIGSLPGFFHFSMGQAFRSRKPQTQAEQEELQRVHEQTSGGFLAADEMAYRIFIDYMDGLLASRRFHPDEEVLILDGIPRRRTQAEWLADKVECIRVIQLVCDEKEILRRVKQRALQQGRADDTSEVLKTRLEVYRQELKPLMSFFAEEKVVRVDSQGPAHQVLRKILESME